MASNRKQAAAAVDKALDDARRVSDKTISIRGAREHNLKNVDLTIPRDKFVVFTGLSGSGKSSLAFDTIYAEGQRRYVESLSAYARQFLEMMQKPDVDQIDGLSPAISIDQKGASRNPRSTVGTVTEIYDHLRLLFARIGHPHCPTCGREIERQSVQQIVDQIKAQIASGALQPGDQLPTVRALATEALAQPEEAVPCLLQWAGLECLTGVEEQLSLLRNVQIGRCL